MKIKIVTILVMFLALAVCADASKFKSAFDGESRYIGNYDIGSYTQAPLRVEEKVWLNIPPEEAMILVSENLTNWIDTIHEVSWDNSESASTNAISEGSVRNCAIGDKKAVEDIRFWNDGDADLKIYGYSLNQTKSTVPFPIKNHLGVFIIERQAGNTSLITQKTYFDKKFHVMAPFITTIMKFKVLDPAFKELAEKYNGVYIKS